jgi:ceramide glucosyltransferase
MIPAVLYLTLLLAKAIAALIYSARHVRPEASDRTGEASLLQAILSGDPGLPTVLEDNLRALPRAEFFWLIDDNDSAAATLTHDLRREYPAHRIHIMSFPPAPEGSNPKVFKLAAAWQRCTTPTCVVLDDDARLSARSLSALVAGLDQADLTTALPYYRAGDRLGSRLLAEFVNNNAALTYLPPLLFISPISINGMGYAIRKERLAGWGGFAPILNHLADDLAMAELVRAHGGKLLQTPHPVEMQTCVQSLRHYQQLMHRWFLFATLLLRQQSLAINALITLLLGTHPLLLWLLLLSAMITPSATTLLALGVTAAGRALVLCILQHRLTGRARHRPLLSLCSELLQPFHLLHAVVDRSIRWRSRSYRVFDNQRFVSK